MVHLVSQQSAAMKGAPILLGKEEYVGDMEPIMCVEFLNFAAMKDVPTRSRREGYVVGMVPELRGRYAQLKGVPTNSRREEFVVSMVLSKKKEVYFAVAAYQNTRRSYSIVLVNCDR